MTPDDSSGLDLDTLRELDARVSALTPVSTELTSVVMEFYTATEEITHQVCKPHLLPEDPGTNLSLAHYTSLEATFNIVSSGPGGFFRLYDSAHVNDPTEGIATSEGEGISDSLSSIRSFASPTRSALGIHAQKFSTAYLLSFLANTARSDPGDDLNFWRSYGRDGCGCSFTFFPYRSNWPHHVVTGLRRVAYDVPNVPDYQEGTRLLLRIHDALSSLVRPRSVMADKLATTRPLLDDWFARRFLIKHAAYKPENEIRFVTFPRDGQDICYDLPNGQIRHYLNLPDFKLKLLFASSTILRVGPAVAHPEDTVDALRGIWSQNWGSVPPIQIRHSRIPYRTRS